MKKQKDGENDIVGDSQTNDAVPDDSISKESDGEVQLGHMDSRGALEIVSKMQQLHQSNGLSGTSSTENVSEMQQLHQSDGLSGTSSTENVPEMQQLHLSDGLSGTSSIENVLEMQQLHQSDGLWGTSSTENVLEMQQLHQSDVLLGTSSTENVSEMQQLHQSDGLSGTSSTENVPEMQQLHQSDGLSSTSSTENVLEMQQLHQSNGLSGTSSTKNVPKMQQLYQSDGLSGASSTENVSEMQQLHQRDGLSGISSTKNVPEMQQLHQSDGLSGTSSTENVQEMQQLHQSDGLSGTLSTENGPEMQQLHQSDGLSGTSSTENGSKMKKQKDGENDIVGDSQTNDAVPDDSISKEPDGEVQLGHMASRGAPEIVPEMEQLHQSDGLSGTSSTKNEKKIMKVPAILRKVESSNNCYDPMVVAIGPYHHHTIQESKRMEDIKIQFREQYASKCEKSWDELYEEMKMSLVEAKNYYTEDVEISFKNQDEKFAEMMFLDSCFVIQFMDNCVNPDKDSKRITQFDLPFIIRDIMLLENQLPFDILKKLMSFNGQYKGKEMIDKFIAMIINDRRTKKAKRTNEAKEKFVLHLLELVQTRLVDDQEISRRALEYEGAKKTQRSKTCFGFHLPSSNKEIKNESIKITIVDDCERVEEYECAKKETQRWKTCFGFDLPSSNKEIKNESNIKSSFMGWKYRSVLELKPLGIHFEPSTTCQFSDITFTSGHLFGWLKLPPIRIQKGTKSLLLNLMAFEACADLSSNFGVSSYVAFMDTLIDHAGDVKELRSKGIIYNLLSNDEQVAKLFNEMGESVEVVDGRIWASVEESLNAFYNSRCSWWFTECLNNHCRTPWAVIGIVAAIVVVCLTIGQTVFSAIQL